MTPIISDLIKRYESGRLSRRDLVQGLSLLVTAAAVPGAAAAQSGAPTDDRAAAANPPIEPNGIDHICVRVKDLARSAAFYGSLFGLRTLGQDEPHRILRLGRDRVIVSLREDAPHGTIDHFSFGVPGFEKAVVADLLKARGLTTHEDWEYGFYVKDPDGVPVQMVGVR